MLPWFATLGRRQKGSGEGAQDAEEGHGRFLPNGAEGVILNSLQRLSMESTPKVENFCSVD